MNVSTNRQFGAAAAAIAVGSPVMSHLALALGQGYGAAILFAILQAVASGALLLTLLLTRRWVGPLISLALLLALAIGARHGPATALLTMAGAAHALLYGGLLLVFANTLRPGHTALITTLASRLNPTFHVGMVPYTRKVTIGWAALFSAELVASGLLLWRDPPLWQSFVTIYSIPPIIAFALGEALVRQWRWRHEHATSLIDTIRGTRRLMRRP